MDCESKEQSVYYKTVKNIPEFKYKNSLRAKKYRIENADVIREKDQKRRQTTSHKENRKRYIKENKDKIRAQEKLAKLRYHVKNRDGLTDQYVLSKIIQKSPLSKNEIPPDFIRLKRLEIICKRTLKTIKNESQTTA